MSEITVVAMLTIKHDLQTVFVAQLKKLVECSRAEAGCLQYDLHQDNQNPLSYVFIERWVSQAALDAHAQSEHFVSFEQMAKDKVESLDIRVLTKIN